MLNELISKCPACNNKLEKLDSYKICRTSQVEILNDHYEFWFRIYEYSPTDYSDEYSEFCRNFILNNIFYTFILILEKTNIEIHMFNSPILDPSPGKNKTLFKLKSNKDINYKFINYFTTLNDNDFYQKIKHLMTIE